MEENNKMIADFMGWRKHEGYSYITPFYQSYMSVGAGICQTSIFRNEDLKFHKSWDWLIKVFHKIQDIADSAIYKELFEDKFKVLFNNITFLYEAVVEFIKAHNK